MEAVGKITYINGPVVKAIGMEDFMVREMVTVGVKRLLGEVISLDSGTGTVQVYEETSGLRMGETISGTGKPLCVTLGPGILGNIFDGIERPLSDIYDSGFSFIPEGIGLISIDEKAKWDVEVRVRPGDVLYGGYVYAEIEETSFVVHKVMVPPGIKGKAVFVKNSGSYTINETIVVLEDGKNRHELTLCQRWPVRDPRPVVRRMTIKKPLITGQRVIDSFFPLAKGEQHHTRDLRKTITQHQLAKWSDADIIVYIGCGEQEMMTEVLEDFPAERSGGRASH